MSDQAIEPARATQEFVLRAELAIAAAADLDYWLRHAGEALERELRAIAGAEVVTFAGPGAGPDS